MSSAATRDAASMNADNGKNANSNPAVAASNPAQDAAFVKGAIANALPQLLPGARNADVTVRAEVPGVVERPEAVPGKPLAVAASSSSSDPSSSPANKKPAPEKKDGIFFQDVTTPSTAPLILANQEGDINGPPKPPPKPASALIASDNAVAETAKRTAGDASADVVRARGAAALPALTPDREARLEAALDKFFDKLTSPQTEEMVQRASKGALNGVLVASSSSGSGSSSSSSNNAFASVIEGGGNLPAGNEPDATSPGGIGGNAGFLGIPLSDVRRVARSSGGGGRRMRSLGGREPAAASSSSSQTSSRPLPPRLPAPAKLSATSAPQPMGHNPPRSEGDELGPDHRPPALATLDDKEAAGRVFAAEVAELASVAAAPEPSPFAQQQLFVAPETAFEAASASSPAPFAAASRPALEARSASSPIGHLPPHSSLSRSEPIDHRPPMGHRPPMDHRPPLSGVEV
jgi:hypothetical protein